MSKRDQGCVVPDRGDDGMRMLSMIPVVGVVTLAVGWVLYRGLVALSAWVTR